MSLVLLGVVIEDKGEKAMISNPARKYHFRRDGSVMLSIEILRAEPDMLAASMTLLIAYLMRAVGRSEKRVLTVEQWSMHICVVCRGSTERVEWCMFVHDFLLVG